MLYYRVTIITENTNNYYWTAMRNVSFFSFIFIIVSNEQVAEDKTIVRIADKRLSHIFYGAKEIKSFRYYCHFESVKFHENVYSIFSNTLVCLIAVFQL